MRVRLAAAVALALLVGGCTGIPTDGPVREVPADEEVSQEAVRYAPAPPTPGASPQQVVSGFLDSMLAYPRSTGVAESYLTDDAAERWNPVAGTTVYAGADVSAPRPEGNSAVRVGLATRDVATLDARGRLDVDPGAVDRSLVLQRVDGEWRIDRLPDGQLVTERFFEDYYRPFDLGFFDRPGRRLVPTVVHVPIGEQLPTALVTSLARGPADPTADLRSFVPDLGDVRPSVPVDGDGIAEVDLGSGAVDLPERDQARLSAQVAWTLGQVPGVRGVRISAGTSLLSPGGQAVQTADTWRRYGPRSASSGPFVLTDDAVRELIGVSTRDVAESWVELAGDAASVVVGRARVALVEPGGASVQVRGRTGGDLTTVPTEEVLDVVWLPDDVLVVVDRPDDLRVRLLDGDVLRPVPAGIAGRADVTSVAVSSDGARYAAALDDGRVLVGAVDRDTEDGVRGLGRAAAVPTTSPAAGSIAWADDSRLAYLSSTPVGTRVVEVLLDGTTVAGPGVGGSPVLPDVRGVEVLATGERRWIVGAGGGLWVLVDDAGWQRVDLDAVRAVSPAG